MHRLLTLLFICALPSAVPAQMSDFLSVRRPNGRSIKTFYAGSPISLITRTGIPLSGTINTMRNDTLFISAFNIRIVPTYLGVTVVDTFARRIEKVHYKDVGRIEVYSKHRGNYGKAGWLATVGGAGYIFLNVFNGLIHNEGITDKANLKRLTPAAAVSVSGILVQVLTKKSTFNRRRQRIVYVSLN